MNFYNPYMKLHSIKLCNFKSYTNEHEIGPFDNFTCIVGPNGSGKSNIMDAICFALSINSSFLRAVNLSDLINNDAEFASVTLILTDLNDKQTEAKNENSTIINEPEAMNLLSTNKVNSDCRNNDLLINNANIGPMSKVHLRRTINRNNVSNYYINNMQTPQKQYIDFLESYNIFPRSKNFVIFQGEIDSIALKSPIDITKLLEEISTSTKYKQAYDTHYLKMTSLFTQSAQIMAQKKEMLSKIKLITESKESKKKLKIKLKQKDDLEMKIKLIDVKKWYNNVIEINDILKMLYEKRTQISDSNWKLNEKVDMSEMFVLQNDVLMLEKETEDLMMRRVDTAKMEAERKTLNHKIAYGQKQIQEIESIICEKRKNKDKLEGEIKEISEVYQTCIIEFEKMNKDFKIDESIIKQFNKFEDVYECKIGELKKKKFEIEKSIGPFTREINSNESKIKGFKKQNTEFSDEIKNINKNMSDAKQKIDLNNANISFFNEKQKDGFLKYNKILEDEKILNQSLNSIMKKLIGIKQQKKESDRRIRINDAIERLKAMFPGVYGKVIDLIEPSQKKYNLSLSVLLGGHELSVIVDNDATAVKCIEYMREKKIARVTFLPINNLVIKRDENFDSSLRSSYLLALDTVSFDKKYFKAMYYVLGNSLITSSVDEAKEILYERKLHVKICVLNGLLFHKNGNITGGSFDNKFTDKEFTKLLNEKNAILDKLKEMKMYKNNFVHIEIANKKVKDMEYENELLEKQVNEYTQKKAFIDERMHNINECINDCEKQCITNTKNIKEGQLLLSKIDSDLKIIESEVFSKFKYGSRVREFKEFLENGKYFRLQKEAEHDNLIQNLQTRISGILYEIEDLMQKRETELNKLEINKKKTEIEFDVEKIDSEVYQKQEALKKSKKRFKDMKKQNDLVTSLMTENRNAISKINEDIIKHEKELAVKIDTIKEMMREMELEEYKIPTLKNYEHDRNPQTYNKENIDQNMLNQKENVMKNIKMITLGSIGHSLDQNKEHVIEDIKKIDFSIIKHSQEHYSNELLIIKKEIEDCIPRTKIKESTTIQTQYDKLNSEYEQLKQEAIQARINFTEVKNKRINTFMECYNKVNESLGNIYRLLTQDNDSPGNAYLLLENNTEPYLSGIKYYAMPPRKRYREIKALSGGEKTMTALALLFALHSYKPSPFYIFDEMDSALDKINVNSIIDYILKSNVQFIVITLKPIIFQHSDSLVGIYKLDNKSSVLTYRLD